MFETGTSKSGSIRPKIGLDDFNSSMSLTESMSLTHTRASVGKLVPEQTSLLVFIFLTNVFEFGNFSNSILSASFFFGLIRHLLYPQRDSTCS